MNQFGGDWTESKMEMVVSYAKAYLTIMKEQKWASTLYFDGFAGSGVIETEEDKEGLKGTAIRILEIDEPKPFDLYYFVELNEQNKRELEHTIRERFLGKNAHVVKDDCNKKLKDLAVFLKANSNYRALAFIDPYGMSVNWSSIEALKGVGIDLWILVPTGLGVNRLLKKDGNISDAWLAKLEIFLGISATDIKNYFYRQQTVNTLFGAETIIEKEKNSISRVGELYSEKLKEVFKFVSHPFVMRNSSNSIMYHFIMATNNATALKIANDVVKPKFKL